MREILFKAKRADNEEWVTGYYIKSIVDGSVFGYIRESIFGTDIKIMLNTLCQYTGLKDKNGKEIFIEFNNGTVTKYRHINDGNNGYEIFDVLGDEKGKSIFEFLSDNITKRSNVHGSFI